MKTFHPLLTLVCVSLLFPVTYSQDQKSKQKDKKPTAQTQPTSEPSATPRPPLAFGLVEDTPVKLKLSRTMSSADAKVDEKVDFEVVEDVKIGDVVVIQHGGIAIATVTEAKPKGRMGKAGKLNMNIDYVQLASGEKVPLRAVKGGSGGTHTAAMTGAIVATSIVFFPAAPFFLFMHGKDITIPKGTEITAYVAGDTPLDPLKFGQTGAANTNSKLGARADANSAVTIKSVPEAAEITVDDKFVGTTPSTIQLTPGEHRIVVSKSGFKNWERTMTVTPNGSISLNPELEKLPQP
ncbi:MAG TPA: PEGA domain-containing protein [Pyrinomonadaceae bacterium]|jgi:hydrogenase maturation factor|nr:PEGA domain-containing protein [Pyrinomonadaceae bacterium]